jgi:hypothetical protein
MQTLRQIERFWSAQQYDRLARELLAARPEFSSRLLTELSTSVPCAALALIRLDELNQGHRPFNQTLIRAIIAAQEGDGGWGDPLVSAICLRALLCNGGHGLSIDRGIAYLAELQKPEGLWPAIAVPRTVSDPFVSAFILFQLADSPAFRSAANIEAPVEWFLRNESTLDADTRRLWHRARPRSRMRIAVAAAAVAN